MAGDKTVGTLGSAAQRPRPRAAAARPRRRCARGRHAARRRRRRRCGSSSRLGALCVSRARRRPPNERVAARIPTASSRCPWPKRRSALRRLSRRGMGRAGIRRPRAVREAHARRLPGRAVVDHDPAQARQFPPRLRRFRAGEDRALHAEEGRAADAGRRHRAQPRQDRGHGALGARLSRDHGEGPGLLRSCCGTSSTASRRSTTSAASGRCRPRPRCRARCRRSWPAAASSSSGRPSSMPSCRRSAWSTIIWSTCHRHAACAKLARQLSRKQTAASTPRSTRQAAPPRLAAHAVGPPARPARSLAARRRDRGHRPWARARRALERPDQGRAYLLGRAALAAGRGHRARSARGSTAGAGSRCCCTTRPNT